jgi:pimeloyl-ACP methyl ester carboxylesterase
MRSRYLLCAGYEIHFTEWGDQSAAPVVMWHGLARTARDFDELAASLAGRYRVICPDTIGRGASQWARDRDRDYCFAVYTDIAFDLLDQLGIERLRWVGTSMGALIGVHLAADRLRERITHLLLNDIGPEIPAAAVDRIASYVGNPPRFPSFSAFENWLREVYAPFGIQSDERWRHLAETSCRRMDDGQFTVHYDPKIVTQLTTHAGDLDLWPAYDRIRCQALLLRGAISDVLPRAVADAMTQRGPRPSLMEVPGVGHAPAFDTPEQRQAVARFLES